MKKTLTLFLMLLLIGWAGITDLYAQTQLYGMTAFGGTYNMGTIFHFTPSSVTHTLDQSFISSISGSSPQYTNLTDGSNGKFYGMTSVGGTHNLGVIFEWDPAANTYTKKIDFDGTNGSNPYGSLTLSGGKFYGMTVNGGAGGIGVIFEWDPATNIYTKKIDFDGTNGKYPLGSLTLTGGKFYGMTDMGGLSELGVIFEWDPATNTCTKKIDFDGTNGSAPFGSLTQSGGKLYGMTYYGGINSHGVIFEWDPATNAYVKKIDFDGTNGGYPRGSLTLAGGKFYGLAEVGGINSFGVIFEWDPATNTYTKRIDFDGTNGSVPFGSLTQSGGKFYGMTYMGGPSDLGVIFEWDPVANNCIKKIDFAGPNGSKPQSSLTLSGANFYGMTTDGGKDGVGVIFEWAPATNSFTKKIDFILNGSYPFGSLTRYGDKLYGMAEYGGANNDGIIFEYDPAANTYTEKIDFESINGSLPQASLTLSNGKFYGMTSAGGTGGLGVIFEWDPVTNNCTKKIDFTGPNGGNPQGSLTRSGGKLYGMTSAGGTGGFGVIFEWDPATNTYTKKIDLDGTNGSNPYGSLTLSGGKFYGMTNMGGIHDMGVIFEWDPVTNTYTKKLDFDDTNGKYPNGSLTSDGGIFYGVTTSGGANSNGVIFEWDPATNTYTKKIDFLFVSGAYPVGSLTLSSGMFYGLTRSGGFGNGAIFEWNPMINIYTDHLNFNVNGTNGASPWFTTLLEYTLPDTWTGAIDNDWANTGNWSTGTVPTSSANVFIPGVTNNPVVGSGTLAESYDLSIDAGAMLTVSSGGSFTMSGELTNNAGDAGFIIESGASFKHTTSGANGTAMRTIASNSEWHYISCPIDQATMPEICDNNFAPSTWDFNSGTGATYDFFSWKESSATGGVNWINLKNSDWSVNTTDFGSPPRFVRGKGYLAEYSSAFAGSADKTFTGTFGVGSIVIPVTKSTGGNLYNLIGDPYPSYIDWKAFGWDRSSLEDDAGGKDFWIWNDAVGNYGVYNSASAGDAGTNGVTRYIAPEQGFFVKAAADGNVTMTDDVRCHSTQAWLKAAGNNLRLVATSSMNEYSDEVMLEFGHQVTGGAEKWFSMYSEAPSLYLPVGPDIYSLRFLSEISENPVVPLSFKAGQDGNHTITTSGTEGFTNVILQDLKTGTSQELKTNPIYTFTGSTTDDVNRFLLKFTPVGIETQNAGNNGIYIYNNILNISNPGESVIQIYNMMGQKIEEQQAKNEAVYRINLQVVTGYYLVKVTSDKQVYATKVFVK